MNEQKNNSESPATNKGPEGEPEPSDPSFNTQELKSKLKEKSKENKVLQTKLSKLQTKYVTLFKEQKPLKKQNEILKNFVKKILPEVQNRMSEMDGDELNLIWTQREEEKTKEIKDQEDKLQQEKKEFREKMLEESELKIQTIELQSKAQIQNISKELESFKKNNKNISEQIADLDKKLVEKTEEISRLTKEKLKLEHQINHLKMENITQELSHEGHKGASQKQTMQRNQFLAMRQQVDSLMQKRDNLRKQLKESRKETDKAREQLKVKNTQIEKISKQMHEMQRILTQFQKSEQKVEQKEETMVMKLESKESISSSNGDEMRNGDLHHLAEDDEYVHREYMKNVFMRYMACWSSGDSEQAGVLLNIIETILKMSHLERESLSNKRKNWWKVI